MRPLLLGAVAALLLQTTVARPAEPPLWVDTMPAPDQAISYMSAFPSGDAFVYFHNRPGEIFWSGDFGATWSTRSAPPGGATAFEMASPETGYLASGHQVHRTDDGSVGWKSLPDPELPGPYFVPRSEGRQKGWDLAINSIAVTERVSRFSLGGELTHVTKHSTDGGDCYHGRSWAVLLLADDGGRSGSYRIHRFGFPGTVRRHGWLTSKVGWALVRPWTEIDACGKAATGDTYLYLTHDAGETYRRVYACPCTSAAMATKQRIVVGRSDGWLYLSKDGGHGFEPQRYIGNPGGEGIHFWWVNGIAFADRNVGYAVAQGGGVYRTDDGGESWTLEPSSQSAGGFALGDLAIADADHAIAGGPNSIIARIP